MQIDAEAEGQASSIGNGSDGEVQPSSNEGLRTKKIMVQLSESILERLEAATERPGVGKSVVVETALQRFLAPAQGAEGLIRETLDRVSGQMARLERQVAIVAETVALHARYHLTVTAAMQSSQQRDAGLLGQERCNVLVQQVERGVRLGQPLIQETIDRLGMPSWRASETGGGVSERRTVEELLQEGSSAPAVEGGSHPSAAAEEGGSKLNFRNLSSSFC
ncbi:hypothetical protein [Bradyrhizobium sp. 187]|uniref:hypothetical protein n=1 Tax=Bradyrhizobium sp. 187 TaxID=2782655 RepID=UPI002000336A|nr:hypothetical protein [Bradyrhizobium sp. 187]UPJ76904.1 hypothetical protein IVB19_39225 [Bradyrhizobium sp. 187]